MARSTKGKIIVADSPEELEEQLRDFAELPGRPSHGEDKSIADPVGELITNPPPGPGPFNPDDVPGDIDSPPDPGDGPTQDPDPMHSAQIVPHDKQPPIPGMSRYESRIHVVDAWKYTGSLHSRPDFVSPEWVSWAEYDERTKQPAGPALRVPTDGPYAEKLCRKGDYIVKQLVTMDHSMPAYPQLDVWTEAEFERMFIPRDIIRDVS